MPIHAVPEELLHRILRLHFSRIPEAFCGESTEGTEWRFKQIATRQVPAVPPCDALLVSKRWLRVGTPLLYEFLSLSNAEQTTQVATLFRTQPILGKAVRHVRLRGGFGKSLKTVLGAITKLESLSVTVRYLQGRDSITGLRSAIPKLKPSALYIDIPISHHMLNKNQRELAVAFTTAIEKQWTTLNLLYFFGSFGGPIGEVLAAVCASKSLRVISIALKDVLRWMTAGLGEESNAERPPVTLEYRAAHESAKEYVERICSENSISKKAIGRLLPAAVLPKESWANQPMRIMWQEDSSYWKCRAG